MADVFLSYKREDVRAAKVIAKALRAEGFSVFFDEMIPVGDMWDWAIERGLAEAKAVVPVWTPRSVTSKWVRIEAQEGDRREILSPILLENCTVPLAFSLTEAADLRAWKLGDRANPEWRNLISTLERLAGPRSRYARPRAGRQLARSPEQLLLPLERPPEPNPGETAWVAFCRTARAGFGSATSQDFISYRVAAGQDFAWAQYMVGVMYLLGRGAAEDPLEAIRWLKLAAAGGYYAADYALGIMYEFGAGIRSDTRRARPCYKRAAKKGHELAKAGLDRLSSGR